LEDFQANNVQVEKICFQDSDSCDSECTEGYFSRQNSKAAEESDSCPEIENLVTKECPDDKNLVISRENSKATDSFPENKNLVTEKCPDDKNLVIKPKKKSIDYTKKEVEFSKAFDGADHIVTFFYKTLN